jgi:hypothetical protein
MNVVRESTSGQPGDGLQQSQLSACACVRLKGNPLHSDHWPSTKARATATGADYNADALA